MTAFTKDLNDSAKVISIIFKKHKRYLQFKRSQSHISIKSIFPPIMPKNTTIEERKIMMLCCIKGIGRKKSKKILANFKKLRDFFTAEDRILKEKCNIGKRQLKKIKRITQ